MVIGEGRFEVSSEGCCEVMVDGHFWVKVEHSVVVVEVGHLVEVVEVGHFVEVVEVGRFVELVEVGHLVNLMREGWKGQVPV